jgi:TolB protein
MDSVGSSLRRLTTGIDARDPAWNPAGTRLVYTRASNDLFTLRVSSGRRHRLTSGPALDFEPAWSPDGAQIAFTRAFSRGDPGNIYLLTLATGTVVRVTHSPGYDHQVGWAPGGQLLVFERDVATGSSIWTVRPDGSHLRRRSGGQHFDTGPAFSPNGAQIVFASDRHQVGTDLWVMDRASGTIHRLLRLRFLEGAPDWQPIIP